MCFSPNSNLVQRTIDLNYSKKKRASSIKWFFVNVFVFLLFAYDLTCIGPCPASVARYVEMVVASVACASALRHGLSLLPRRALTPTTVSRHQLRLLGLNDADLDSSMVMSEQSACSAASEPAPSEAQLSLSLSPRRWREPRPPHDPPSPHSPSPPSSPPRSPTQDVLSRDRFIADQHSLSDYLKQYEAEQVAELASPLDSGNCPRAGPPPAYQLSALDTEGGKHEEGSPQGSPEVYWQLDIDPQKLTQWNLNLRLWIHITILERLVREMDSVDIALSRLAGGEARLGQLGGERLRQLATAVPSLYALLPYLDSFADQRYVVRRIRELARAPCLSNYRWNAGGSDWDETQPTDAEIILHLFATYLDGQMLQSGNPRPFSSQYLGSGSGGGGGELSLQRVGVRPPQWAVSVGGALGGAAHGRNNLLHALLLLLAAAARRSPPALARTHLGPSGLNMLWILR